MSRPEPSEFARSPQGLAPRQRVGERYEIVRQLGRGGFGHTFLALDLEEEGREVALKTLHDRSLGDPKTYELFEREAAVLRGLRHRGVPELYQHMRAEVGGAPTAILVMEYIDGVSLAEMIDSGAALGPVEVVDHLLGLLDILDYLHTRVPPVLHRDIKPANVIVRRPGGLAVVDFGAVRNVFREADDGGSTVVGTYGYMPYEQYMGQASPASDLYAAGATFLHLVTGRPPASFMSDEGRVEVPASLPLAEPLRGVIARLLESSPARRFESARAARHALLPGEGTAVAPRAPAGPLALVPLGNGPRDLTPGTPAGDLFKRVAYGPWRMMNSAVTGTERMGVIDVVLIGFFSVVTLGVLPVSFFALSRARRNRLRPFFERGLEALATIATFKDEATAFGEKLVRLGYDFEVDGRTHRGSDQVHPGVANRLREGDRVEVLYLPERGYDSVIVGGHG